MYNAIITVFNYYESTGMSIWYPHILTCVDVNVGKGWMLKKYGTDNSDNAELHISYTMNGEQKLIRDSSGKAIPWIPPKQWRQQESNLLEDTITFGLNDFFWLGEWGGGKINDKDYQDRRYHGFYSYMNDLYDYVYLISTVSGPYSLIPHFEIMGK